ncbi:MAG: DHHA1 domain-containing protein [Candidatus Aenigmatarchaeota archaeon]
MEDLLRKGISFIERIKSSDKIFLIYHKDLDGLMSALIFVRCMKKNGVKIHKKVASSNEEIEGVIKKVKGFDKILIFDIDISYMKKYLVELNKDILIVDHHPPRSNLNTKRIVYINPRLSKPKIYQPTSYVTYKLLSRICNMKNEEWLAVLGVVSDYAFEDCKDLVKKWLRIKKKDSLQRTKIWKEVEELVGIISEINFSRTLTLLENAKSLEDFKKNKVVRKAAGKYIKNIRKCEKSFWENVREFKRSNLILSEVETRHREIASLISTRMVRKFPGKVLVVLRKVGKKYAVHARYHGSKEIELGKIMEKCAKGLNGGGGHPYAAGAAIKIKNREIFEKRLIEELGKTFKS